MEWGEKTPFERGVTFPVNGKRLFPEAVLTWEDIGIVESPSWRNFRKWADSESTSGAIERKKRDNYVVIGSMPKRRCDSTFNRKRYQSPEIGANIRLPYVGGCGCAAFVPFSQPPCCTCACTCQGSSWSRSGVICSGMLLFVPLSRCSLLADASCILVSMDAQ
jgi:hypothetical protein